MSAPGFLFHFHRLPIRTLPAAFRLLNPSHKLVQRAGPSSIGAPPGKVLILARLLHEDLGLFPKVLVDGSFAAALEELEIPIQPGRGRRVPLDAAVGAREEELPLLGRDLKRQIALPLHPAQRESVAVHLAEDVRLRCDARSKTGCM
jgi:hypothetical protein